MGMLAGIPALLEAAGPVLKPMLMWMMASQGMDIGADLLKGKFPSMSPEYRMLERQIEAQHEMEARKEGAMEKMSEQGLKSMMLQRTMAKHDQADAFAREAVLQQGAGAAPAAAAISVSPAALSKTVSFKDIFGLTGA